MSRNKTPLIAATLTGLALVIGSGAARANGPTVIELSQTACQFIESENGVDHGVQSRSKSDCKAINGESGSQRLSESKPLELKPGRYVFRVTNQDVPYSLGFWLRGKGLVGLATKPSVSGGGLEEGQTKDFEIELVEGEYLYSCPLNPTPDYRLVVKS